MSDQHLKLEWASLRLLVDGYNLAFESGAVQHGDTTPNALRAARDKLLKHISQSLPAEIIKRTLVVFDSAASPRGRTDDAVQFGISIKFSSDWNSADELIQLIIESHHSPKILTVVSSDHSIQRKALARGATTFDCEDWLDQLEVQVDVTDRNKEDSPGVNGLRDRTLSKREHRDWLREFGFRDDSDVS